MNINIFSEFAEIVRGNKILKRLFRTEKEKRDISVLVMPDNDKELNECAIRYLDAYCAYNFLKKLFIVTTEDIHIPAPSLSLKNRCDIETVYINEKDMRAILHFCAIFNAPYLCVISLDKPYGQFLFRMLGHKNLKLEDLVCRCLYKLKEVPEIKEVNGLT